MDNEQFLEAIRWNADSCAVKAKRGHYVPHAENWSLVEDRTCSRCGSKRVSRHNWQETYKEKNLPTKTVTIHGYACLNCWRRWR